MYNHENIRGVYVNKAPWNEIHFWSIVSSLIIVVVGLSQPWAGCNYDLSDLEKLKLVANSSDCVRTQAEVNDDFSSTTQGIMVQPFGILTYIASMFTFLSFCL